MPISTSGLTVPQIGQQFDTSMYGNAIPTKQELPKGMTIGDMLDLSKKSLELKKAKELYEPEVSGKKAESQRLQLEAQKANIDLKQHTANIGRAVYGGYLTDPDFINGNSEKMVQKLNDAQTFLTEQGLTSVDGGKGHDYLVNLAKKDPQAAYQVIKNGVQIAGGNAQQYQSLQPTQPTAIYQGNQPPVSAPPSAQPQEQYSQPEAVPAGYKPPVPGQPRALLPSEEGDRAAGEKTRLDLARNQLSYGTNIQNYDKVIDQANKIANDNLFTSGVAGSYERKLKTAFGSPEYIQLSKNLANAQIAQILASGGSLESDAGKALTAAANGDYTYPPEVIVEIARQNASKLEKENSLANGIKAASVKFGDAIANRKFLSEWNKNANDNSVWEMKYIYDHAKNPQDGIAHVDSYIKSHGLDAKRKELATKFKNLQELEKNGELSGR
jgi:hypothetical protein